MIWTSYLDMVYQIAFISFNINMCNWLIKTVNNPFSNNGIPQLKKTIYFSIFCVLVYTASVFPRSVFNYQYDQKPLTIDVFNKYIADDLLLHELE